MTRQKQTLSSFLTRAKLRDMTGEKVYARGEAYHMRGAAHVLYHTPVEAAAEVTGSFPYRVDLALDADNRLTADCTCPAMQDWGFCKHAVAAGLALIDAPAPTLERPPQARPPQRDSFAERYPNLAAWIRNGHIEIGRDGFSASMIRLIHDDNVMWEGGTRHKAIDKMLEEAEEAAKEY